MPRKKVPCSKCGDPRPIGKGSQPPEKLLCRSCRREQRQRACPVCGEFFVAQKPVDDRYLCCSRACAARARKASPKAVRSRPCVDCGAEVCNTGVVPLCPPCSKVRTHNRGVAKTRARRALKRGSASEPYTLAEIAERDRFRCGLCGAGVPMSRKRPHPDSPVIDHLVPIVLGGDDTRANVHLAHFHCNAVKGARPIGKQPAIVGQEVHGAG